MSKNEEVEMEKDTTGITEDLLCRVEDEMIDLRDKLFKLSEFLTYGAGRAHYRQIELLRIQQDAMGAYYKVLLARTNHLKAHLGFTDKTLGNLPFRG